MSWMTMWAGAHPVYLAEAHGATVVDVDGNEYADLCLGDTGAMAGHSPPLPTLPASRRCCRRRTRPGWARSWRAGFGIPFWQFP